MGVSVKRFAGAESDDLARKLGIMVENTGIYR